MFETKNEHQATIIGEGIKLEGDFSGQGDLELYGQLKGNISITGRLKVGPNAQIVANVIADHAEVAGVIKGKVSITHAIDIAATGNIHGDVKAQEITIAKGAAINGKVNIDLKNDVTPSTRKAEKAEE